MGFLFDAKAPVALALTVLFYLLTVAQTLHALFFLCRRDTRAASVASLFELLVLAHLLIGCAGADSLYNGYGTALFRMKAIALPVETLLWANAAAAVAALLLAWRQKNPQRLFEAVLLGACTPAVVSLAGPAIVYLVIADACYFAFRTGLSLAIDVRYNRENVSLISVVNAVDALPEGVICADERGRILFMNDSMRECLTSLGFATDLADTASLWDDLERMARAGTCPADASLPEGVRLQISPAQTRLFVRDRVLLGKKEYRRMVAIDVTEEESVNVEIEQTNRLMEAANAELSESMGNVAELARDEALLHMKARVHDTIGQRLSILHRYLEDDDAEEKGLSQVIALLRSIVDDLASPEDPSSAEDRALELASIEDAFSLVGIALEVTGKLPSDDAVAQAFVQVIREASTNAAKHAQAQRITVVLSERDGTARLVVGNDEAPPVKNMHEGTGLPLMREAMEKVGGSLSVASTSPFTLVAKAPMERESGNRDPDQGGRP